MQSEKGDILKTESIVKPNKNCIPFQNVMWLIFPTRTREKAIQIMFNYFLLSTINLFYKTFNFDRLYKTTVPFNIYVDKAYYLFSYIFIYKSRTRLFFRDLGTPNYTLIFTSLLEISFSQQFKYSWDQKYCHLGIPLRECRNKMSWLLLITVQLLSCSIFLMNSTYIHNALWKRYSVWKFFSSKIFAYLKHLLSFLSWFFLSS